MIQPVAMVTDDTPPTPCPDPHCTFTVPLVRMYLICWRQAEIYREPFPDILRARSRNSRVIDPWIRGGRFDPYTAIDIGLALEDARDRGGLTLASWNAEKVAKWLCPNTHT